MKNKIMKIAISLFSLTLFLHLGGCSSTRYPDLNKMNMASDQLMSAAEKGDLSSVQKLVNEKFDGKHTISVDSSVNGMTALMLAAQNGHTDIVKTLINAKADVNAKTDANASGVTTDGLTVLMGGFTALMLASENNHTDTVKTLINAKADVNTKNNAGETALMLAFKKCNTDTVKDLIDAKADVNAKKNNGASVLQIANSVCANKKEIVLLLEQAGAKE